MNRPSCNVIRVKRESVKERGKQLFSAPKFACKNACYFFSYIFCMSFVSCSFVGDFLLTLPHSQMQFSCNPMLSMSLQTSCLAMGVPSESGKLLAMPISIWSGPVWFWAHPPATGILFNILSAYCNLLKVNSICTELPLAITKGGDGRRLFTQTRHYCAVYSVQCPLKRHDKLHSLSQM